MESQTPLVDRIIEIGKQEPMQDFDISPEVKEKVHQFITKDIYSFNS